MDKYTTGRTALKEALRAMFKSLESSSCRFNYRKKVAVTAKFSNADKAMDERHKVCSALCTPYLLLMSNTYRRHKSEH